LSTGKAAGRRTLKVRVPGALFDVVDVVGDGVVIVDVADAAESQLFMAGRALHWIAMDDALQPLVEVGAAFRAADLDPVILDFVFVRIGHGVAPTPNLPENR
jgi:hypothetical protein